MNADIDSLKTIGFAGLSFFLLKEGIKVTWYFIKQRKENGNGQTLESDLKETSRQRIKEINDGLQKLQPAFYDHIHQCDDMHEIITAKDKGVPLIYNKGLETAINQLTIAIKDMPK